MHTRVSRIIPLGAALLMWGLTSYAQAVSFWLFEYSGVGSDPGGAQLGSGTLDSLTLAVTATAPWDGAIAPGSVLAFSGSVTNTAPAGSTGTWNFGLGDLTALNLTAAGGAPDPDNFTLSFGTTALAPINTGTTPNTPYFSAQSASNTRFIYSGSGSGSQDYTRYQLGSQNVLDNGTGTVTVTYIPEPETVAATVLVGLLGLLTLRRRRDDPRHPAS